MRKLRSDQKHGQIRPPQLKTADRLGVQLSDPYGKDLLGLKQMAWVWPVDLFFNEDDLVESPNILASG